MERTPDSAGPGSPWQPPGVRQGHIPVRVAGRDGAVAEHARLYIEERGPLQTVLDMALGLQQDVDPVAAGQERKGRDVALDPRPEVALSQVGRSGHLAVQGRHRLAQAVDDGQLALHVRQDLRDVHDDPRGATGHDRVRVASAGLADLESPDEGLVPSTTIAIGSLEQVSRGRALEGSEVTVDRL